MKYKHLIIEKKEYELLKRILSMSKYYKDESYRASISKLKEELEKAKFMSEKNMPEDVVRFNSIVTIQTPFGPEKKYQLVTPDKSNVAENKISVLAPMGSALIGYAAEDEIKWQFPSGLHNIKIVHVEKKETVVE